MVLQSGTRLGSYKITALLGSGGTGQVYKARDLKLDRDVAVKVLREELASDPERLRRFEQEARAASGLNHPNIITIHDIDQHGSTCYIAMELVEGKTLREILSEGPLSIKRLLDIGAQIADGLAKAHGAGIVHRDLWVKRIPPLLGVPSPTTSTGLPQRRVSTERSSSLQDMRPPIFGMGAFSPRWVVSMAQRRK